MSEKLTVPDEVYEEASRLSEEKDMTMKEAIRIMVRDGGYDV